MRAGKISGVLGDGQGDQLMNIWRSLRRVCLTSTTALELATYLGAPAQEPAAPPRANVFLVSKSLSDQKGGLSVDTFATACP